MKLFKITENDSNQRLDRFLRKLLKNSSISLIYKLNRKKKVKVNSKKQDIKYRLQIWDEIKIFLRDKDFKELSKNKTSIINSDNRKLDKRDIIYEDGYLLILNKKAWINVHPWDYKTKEISIIEQCRDYLWEKYDSLTFKPSLIHRIDRDTSWIILIAKKKDILTKLVKDFRDHKKIKKIYITYVFWRPNKNTGTINKKLFRIKNAEKENKIKISEKWQKAITHYKVLNMKKIKTRFWYETISELEIEIETWRMHQIRVHLSSIWCPVIWDNKYWDLKLNSYISKNLWLSRQALHSSKISFFHYWKSKQLEVKAELKWDMKKVF
jgi:RluA family pseudouridine synthase